MKKLCGLLLALLLLAGCTTTVPTTVQDDVGKKYIAALKEWTPKEKNPENTENNPEFETFLDDYFIDSVSSDYMTLHYTVKDYRALGIEKPEVTLGEISYEPADISEMEEDLKRLQAFDFASLSYRQQVDYEIMEYSFYETIIDVVYGKYDLLFSAGSGLQSNLLTNFTEYVFYDEESVEDYLVLLADVDRYIEDAVAYTKAQAEEGIALSDTGLDDTLDYIDKFVSKTEDNELINAFNAGLRQTNFLSREQIKQYEEQNKQIVLEEIIPAYEKLATELESLRGKGKLSADNASIRNYSPEYAEGKFLLACSSNKSIDDIFDMTEDAMMGLFLEASSVVSDSEVLDEYEAVTGGEVECAGLNLGLDETLQYLQDHIYAYYPESEVMTFKASPLDPSVANDSILAYYMTPPVDAPDQNVIRTNENTLGDNAVTTYTTLAHEGFPGHLYQHVYYARTNPHNIRSVFSFIGYTEGYAMQAQYDAMRFAGFVHEETGQLLAMDELVIYMLEALCDIGVNYKGWTVKELEEYLDTYGYGAAAESIYAFVTDEPAMITPYGVGVAHFLTLRQETQERMGDAFDLVEYNRTVLKDGPVQFPLLWQLVGQYK